MSVIEKARAPSCSTTGALASSSPLARARAPIKPFSLFMRNPANTAGSRLVYVRDPCIPVVHSLVLTVFQWYKA